MPWYPGAVRRPINRNYTRRKTTKNANILHTDAGNAYDLYGWWMNPANTQASSHFHVAKDGKIFQYIDTDHISWASGAANSRSISYETQGYGTEAWTPAQIVSLVKVLRWASDVHGIPIRQMRSSAVSEKGIGWHRQGVNGNFPSGLLGGVRQNGGQVWSNAKGKRCPGTLRIQQIPGIVRQLQDPTITPASTTPERTWFDMATEADLKKIVREELHAALNNDVIDVLRSGNIKKISAMDALQNTDGGMNSILGTVLAHTGELAGLKTAVSQLADSQGINGDDIIGAVEAAVSKALPAEITVPLSPKEA